MSNDPKKDEEAIFYSALELTSPDARAAFVKEACGDDKELLARVCALLKADGIEDGFLQDPSSLLDLPPLNGAIEEGVGVVIGRYRLLEKIGEGGMAVVYMAEQQEPVRRMVALKIIKLGMDTKRVIARFKAERQALAILDHPNIATIYDGGATENGRPYFVMELVKGSSITAYCEQESVGLKDRLELFLQVCDAVHHAHQAGIIHRDLKPMNVLVSVQGGHAVPKVIDFGIAKALQSEYTEDTLFTQHGQLIGTPAYMSPEQTGLHGTEVDQRTDVYSLGVLLYELLTGATPFAKEEFQGAPYDEICRIIREGEPAKPSARLSTIGEYSIGAASGQLVDREQLCRMVRGELDWIVMRALEKDRNRRYETAQGLARDIERHLHDEPVEAGPPTTLYRLSKFTRRHRLAVAFAALTTAALALGATTAGLIGFPFGPGRPEHAQGMVQRHLWDVPPWSDFAGGVSPDGRYVSYVDWAAGNLAIRDFETETSWLVTKNTDPTWKTIEGWVDSATMSPDGAQMAYSWFHEQGPKFSDLRVVDLDGSNMRVLYRDAATSWIWVYAWSPDGGKVLAYFADADKRLWDESTQQHYSEGHLVLVSTKDGSVKTIRSWRRKAMPKKAAFSPDGRFVAYDLEQENDPDSRDLFLLDLETDSETALIEHPANDRLTGWTPDGRRILFISDRGSTDGLWMIEVAGGGPQGGARQLVGQFEGSTMGFGSTGSLYYTLAATATNVYIASLDAAGVEFVGEPRLASSRHIGSATMADWSSDGQLLAYRVDVSGRRTNTFYLGDWGIVITSTETGEEHVVSATPPFRPNTRMAGPWWSPQRDRLLVSGTSEETGYGLHQIDAATGEVALVMNVSEGGIPAAQWSPDATSIYFYTRQNLSAVDLATNEAKTLHEGLFDSGVFDLSPDGQWLAFWQSRTSLAVMPSTGGVLREVTRLDREPPSTSYKFVKWTPDGEHLLYPDQDQLKKVHVETGRQQQIGPPMQDLVDVAMHPDGTKLAFTIEKSGTGLWVMESFLPK